MKKILLAGVMVLASATASLAAPQAHAPAWSWTGCYVGGNAGYGQTHQAWFDPQDEGSGTGRGFVGGGQLGCDYQAGNFVFGVQGMFDGANLTEAHLYTNDHDFTDHTKVSWFATLTGRIGYAFTPAALIYAKGGAAWVRDKFTETCPAGTIGYVCPGEATATRTGWTVGGGMEYRLSQNWSLFAEYDYMGFGTHRSTLVYPSASPTLTYEYDIEQNVQNVLVGVNYRY